MEPSSSSSAPSPASEKGKLFVGGISSETREEALAEHFKKYGEVKEVVVMRDRTTGNGRGFGFVQFAEPDSAERALQEKEKHVIRGRTVSALLALSSLTAPSLWRKEVKCNDFSLFVGDFFFFSFFALFLDFKVYFFCCLCINSCF